MCAGLPPSVLCLVRPLRRLWLAESRSPFDERLPTIHPSVAPLTPTGTRQVPVCGRNQLVAVPPRLCRWPSFLRSRRSGTGYNGSARSNAGSGKVLPDGSLVDGSLANFYECSGAAKTGSACVSGGIAVVSFSNRTAGSNKANPTTKVIVHHGKEVFTPICFAA
jgi:hypothetical protein